MPAVVVILEFHDLAVTSEGSRNSDGHLGGLAARRYEANFLRRRHHAADEFGPLQADVVLATAVQTLRQLPRNCLDHCRVTVPKEAGPMSHPEVHVLVPVHIAFVRSIGGGDEK